MSLGMLVSVDRIIDRGVEQVNRTNAADDDDDIGLARTNGCLQSLNIA
jgi:hypothetical protein